MTKQRPDAVIHEDFLAWIPWDTTRTIPFRIEGSKGGAWVKVLAREPETGAASLLYRFDPGWSAESIVVGAPENLLVLDGDITVGEHELKTMTYAYRPTGYTKGPCSSENGATVISFGLRPHGELHSPNPVHALDTEAMPWESFSNEFLKSGNARKFLRADEENLDVYMLGKTAPRGVGVDPDWVYSRPTENVAEHEAPEEGYLISGKSVMYDGIIDGLVQLTGGTFVYRPSCSTHRTLGVFEEQVAFMHNFFGPGHQGQDAIRKAQYPIESAAVRAVKEGRNPELPRRW